MITAKRNQRKISKINFYDWVSEVLKHEPLEVLEQEIWYQIGASDSTVQSA